MDRTISTSWSLISPDTGSSNSPEFSKLSCAEGSSDNGDDGMSSKLNMSWFPRAALAGELSVPYPLSRFPEDGLLIFLSLEHTEKAVVPEAEQALKNMQAILEEAGTTMDNVVKATVLLDDINNFGAVNEVYAKFFQKSFPARAAYQVAALPKGAKVEIEAVAIVGKLVDTQ